MAEMSKDEDQAKIAEKAPVYAPDALAKSELPYAIGSACVALLILGSIVYGIASFNRPELIAQALDNPAGTISLIGGFAVLGFLLTMAAVRLGDATFQKASNANYRKIYSSPFLNSFRRTQARRELRVSALEMKLEPVSEKPATETGAYSYGAPSSETPFEQYISEVLRSLSAYAASSESTAEKLLDKGVAFMAGGLAFYVTAIIIWQVFANLTSPDTHVMYIGMAACSMTFVIIEFLAAWFFKQYRYYVEVSLSCLRVRSVYDRYLLGYYALKAFKEDSEVGARDKMMDVLKEDVNWPTYKGSSANDFNYMMESMGAAHTSLEKIRKIFKDSGKGKAQ